MGGSSDDDINLMNIRDGVMVKMLGAGCGIAD